MKNNLTPEQKEQIYYEVLDLIRSHLEFEAVDIKALWLNILEKQVYIELAEPGGYKCHYIYDIVDDCCKLMKISGGE